MKKMLLIGAFLLGGVNICSMEIVSAEYKLSRLDLGCIQKSYVPSQQTDSKIRMVKKYAMVGIIIAAAAGLFKLQGHLFPAEMLGKGSVIAVERSSSSADDGIVFRMAKSMLDTGKGWGRWVVAQVPSFIGGLILKSGYSTFTDHASYYRKIETVNGFIKQKTHINEIFKVLESTAVPYDIYSKYLSVDMNFGEHKMLVQKFVNDASDLIARDSDSMRFYLAQMLRQNYTQRSSELVNLENYALQAVPLQHQKESDLVEQVRMTDHIDRQTIFEMMNVLISDVKSVIAFVIVKNQDTLYRNVLLKNHINLTMQVTNSFVDRIEDLLNADVEQMYEASHKGHGLFDTVYEMRTFLKKMFDQFSSSMTILG